MFNKKFILFYCLLHAINKSYAHKFTNIAQLPVTRALLYGSMKLFDKMLHIMSISTRKMCCIVIIDENLMRRETLVNPEMFIQSLRCG